MSTALLDAIRDVIQQDVNNRGLAHDPHDNLFTACPGDLEAACRSIAGNPHAALAIVTGFYIAHANPPCGETDGPLGAIFLARALTPLGVKVALVTDSFCRRALEVGLKACGLSGTVPIATLPKTEKGVRDFFERVPDTLFPFLPTHLVALERVGPGRDGRCRNMRGLDISDNTAPAHILFEDASSLIPQLTTIGIGDGGNEIGMGKIPSEVIERNIPNGAEIACRIPADHLIVSGVSNWGAYALAAGVAVLRGQRLPHSLFDVEAERELLRDMVMDGPLVDGVKGRQEVSVDGLPFDEYARPLRRLGELLGA
jgi:hypothetical protein